MFSIRFARVVGRAGALFAAVLVLLSLGAQRAVAEAPYATGFVLIKSNATLDGCWRAAEQACNQEFGGCARTDQGSIFFRDAQNDVIMFCEEIYIVPGDAVYLSVSMAHATSDGVNALNGRVERMLDVADGVRW